MKKKRRFLLIPLLLVLFLVLGYIYVRTSTVDEEIIAMPEDDIAFTLPTQTESVEEEESVVEEEVEVEIPLDQITINQEILQELYDNSDRVNIVFFATDGSRADTIIFTSYDPSTDQMTMINIPRDTYYYVPGYENKDQRKVNATYDRVKGVGGSTGVKQAISNILGVPVTHYVKFSYEGAANVVNAVGGVDITVPFDMDYDDVWADPELHINLLEGYQHLDGQQSVEYLRFRQNNDGTIKQSDLERIKRMQDFAKVFMKKALSSDLPQVITTTIQEVYTDITLANALNLGIDIIDISMDDVNMITLPGSADPSYFYVDKEAVQNVLIEMYKQDTCQN